MTSAGMATDVLLNDLANALGGDAVDVGQDAASAAFSPWTRPGVPHAVVHPNSTAQVAQVLKLASSARTSVVPWGGLTGLVDGARADGAIAMRFDRFRAIEAIDPLAATMTVQAGCVLEEAARAAEGQGLLLPLDFGARGSATIGGAIATNAGGNRVLRYGMARDMVLGLEVVLADGAILSTMNRLIKNNAGYDLKQLFIGSEGTLGVITRAVLRLRPHPTSQTTALLAVDRFEALAPLLRILERDLAGALSAFEVMWPEFYDLVTTPPAFGRPILPPGSAYYVLIEAQGANPAADDDRFLAVLDEALSCDLVADAVVAKSQAERNRMWALRDDVGQMARNGPIIAFDIGLPVTEMSGYVEGVRAALDARWPGTHLVVFGHLGDGNLHLIASVPHESAREAIEQTVYAPLQDLGGTISAEHGVGLQKRKWLGLSRNPQEVALMHLLKATLDPLSVLNPGKVLA